MRFGEAAFVNERFESQDLGDLFTKFSQSETPLTTEDIDGAVEKIVLELKTSSAADRRTVLIFNVERISTLSPDIRSALSERLRRALTLDPELKRFNYSDIHFLNKALTENLQSTVDLNQQPTVIATDRLYKDSKPESALHTAEPALKKLAAAGPHPNIIAPKYIDTKQGTEIVNYEPTLRTLSSVENLADALSAVSDCLAGAEFLEQQGLVLQDISPNNIGIIEVDTPAPGTKRGVLFDLEGLSVAGTILATRILNRSHREFMPPELTKTRDIPISATEMVYQFGITLEKINKYLKVLNDFGRSPLHRLKIEWLLDKLRPHNVEIRLHRLISKMTAPTPPARPSLAEAKAELVGIIADMKIDLPIP